MISKYSYTKRTTPIEIGKKYGRLTVLAKTSRRKGTSYYYQCRCDCGKECYVTSSRLGVSTMSCGCLKEECRGSHRESQTRLYRIWCLMKARCYNPNFPEYGNYGGRGIKISPDWRSNYPNFKDWAVSAGYDEHLSIDRINVNGDYTPQNCRWADDVTQSNNRRFKSRFSYRGIRKYAKGFYGILTYKGKIYYTKSARTIEDAVENRNRFIIEHSFPHPIQTIKITT